MYSTGIQIAVSYSIGIQIAVSYSTGIRGILSVSKKNIYLLFLEPHVPWGVCEGGYPFVDVELGETKGSGPRIGPSVGPPVAAEGLWPSVRPWQALWWVFAVNRQWACPLGLGHRVGPETRVHGRRGTASDEGKAGGLAATHPARCIVTAVSDLQPTHRAWAGLWGVIFGGRQG